MLRHALRNDEYEIISKDILIKEMVVKRAIKPGEQIDLSGYRYSIIIKGNIGEGAIVNTAYNLTVEGDIGKKSAVSANQGFIIAKTIGDESSIKAGSRIEVCTVGQGASLEARDNIKTQDVGSNCKLVSTEGQVRTGNVGTCTTINACHQIFSKDVGEHAKISSEKSEIYVGIIYPNAEITAFSNINFISIKDDVKLTPKNGQLMEQIDSFGNAFRPYVKSNPTNTSAIQFHQTSSNISVNVKNASLSTLSIEIPLNLDFSKLSESKATLFVMENKPGENTFKIESDKDKVTYNIEKKTSLL